LFNDRIIGDYDDFVNFDEELIENLLPQARDFISAIEGQIDTSES